MTTNDDNQGTGRTSLEYKVKNLVSQLEGILILHKDLLNPEPIQKVISELQEQVPYVTAIEKDMNAIRLEIIGPVKSELEKSAKLSKFSIRGFWVGLVGGLLAIVSLFFY